MNSLVLVVVDTASCEWTMIMVTYVRWWMLFMFQHMMSWDVLIGRQVSMYLTRPYVGPTYIRTKVRLDTISTHNLGWWQTLPIWRDRQRAFCTKDVLRARMHRARHAWPCGGLALNRKTRKVSQATMKAVFYLQRHGRSRLEPTTPTTPATTSVEWW